MTSVAIVGSENRRESAHARKIMDTVRTKGANSLVASSWRRSLVLHQLDPDHAGMPRQRDLVFTREASERNAALVEASGPTLDHVFDLVDDLPASVLLSDAGGVIIDERASGPDDFWTCSIHRWTGLDLSEQSEGTNAVGTCLAERRPVTIIAGEHFYARNMRLVCGAAPIFDAIGGMAGALDITCPATDKSLKMAKAITAIVMSNARRIETALFVRAFPEARITLVPGSGQTGALVAIDANDLVVGATRVARDLLDLTPERMSKPIPAQSLWPRSSESNTATLAEIERRAIEKTLALKGANISAAARALGVGRGTLHRKMALWRD